MTTPYKHEPFTDFSQEENRQVFEQALAKVTESLGQTYPLVINGERIETTDKIVSINPAKKEEVVVPYQKLGKKRQSKRFKLRQKRLKHGATRLQKKEQASYSALRQAFAVKA